MHRARVAWACEQRRHPTYRKYRRHGDHPHHGQQPAPTQGRACCARQVRRFEQPRRPDAADEVLDAAGMLVLPGFVQAHLHLCQTLLRGQADDMGLLDWLNTITGLEYDRDGS